MQALQDPPEVLERFHQELSLVATVARRVAKKFGQSVELDELESLGREGLLVAARRYDATQSVPFRAFAYYRVRGSMIDGIRKMSHLPRRVYEQIRIVEAGDQFAESQLEGALETSKAAQREDAERGLAEHLAGMATAMAVGLVAEPVHSDGEPGGRSRELDPEARTETAQLAALLHEAIGELPDQEETLVRRHYFDGERFDHVAAELGLSKSWASRLHARAIDRMTKRLAARV